MRGHFSWVHPHLAPAPFLLAGLAIAWYVEATRRCDPPPHFRQRLAFGFAVLSMVVAASWPVGELARSTSLLALVLQRELLTLAAAPLFLYSLPVEVGVRLTRPAVVDAIVVRLSEPVPALAFTTILLGVTALPIAVSAESSSSWLRAAVAVVIFVVGVVMWNPVIRRVPGVRQLSAMGMALYLVAQSFAPTYLSFAWIFAPRPLYPSLGGQQAALHLSALMDQRLSGYLAKLVTFGVLWPVAYHFFSRGIDGKTAGGSEGEWTDLERRLERAHRQERRAQQRGNAVPPGV